MMLPCISQAVVWTKLNETPTARIFLDKQSILQKDQYKRVWIKIEYKVFQKNQESPPKDFNSAKVLWYFDCPVQKAATSQVFQYLNNELIYSIAIDPKSAEFIEPVPETEADTAMRFICLAEKAPEPSASSNAKPNAKPDGAKTEAGKSDAAKAESGKTEANKPSTDKAEATKAEPSKKGDAADAKGSEAKESTKPDAKGDAKFNAKGETAKPANVKGDGPKAHWTYEGKEGPEFWGKLSSDYATCDAGRNQSPINIDSVINASMKPLRTLQLSAAKEIFNNGHTVQVNFKEGNLMIVDNKSFEMKQVHFHAPSENTLHGESFPLEAHFVHADPKGNLAVMAVFYREGAANPGLTKLWQQLPKEQGDPDVVKVKVLPGEMIPVKRNYYRFSGSLTTPPCSEGVTWFVMKGTMTASKEQIKQFAEAVHAHNNRPVQPLNGRMVLE